MLSLAVLLNNQFVESNQQPWEQPELIEGFCGAHLTNNSTICNSFLVMEVSISTKRCHRTIFRLKEFWLFALILWKFECNWPSQIPREWHSQEVWPCWRKYGLVGGNWMTQVFNLDLDAGGHIFNLDHTICWKCVILGVGFEVFFSSFTQGDSQLPIASELRCSTLSSSLHATILPMLMD